MQGSVSTKRPIVPVPDDMNELSCHKYLVPFYKIEHILGMIVAVIMSLFTIALGFLIVAQVILRYVFRSPWLGIEELSPLFAMWTYFLGAAYGARIREHIGGGMLTLFAKNILFIKIIRLIGSLICFTVISVFVYYSFANMMANLELGRLSIYMRWPKWWWDASVPVGLSIAGAYFLIQLILEAIDLMICSKAERLVMKEDEQI